VRAFAIVAMVLVFVAGFVLFFFPHDTDRLFAWTIRPTMTAMLMGAGYFGGTYFFFRLLREQHWQRIALGFPAVVAFSGCMTLATALHWDRFNGEHPAFWIWAVGYAVAPAVVVALWLVNRRVASGSTEPAIPTLPSAVRWIVALSGVGALAIAVALVAAPSAVIAIWPWQLTPLTARVIGGWFAVPGLMSLAIALDGRWSAARILFQSQILALAFLVVAVARGWGELDQGTGMWMFVIGILAVLVFSIGLYWRMEAAIRRSPLTRTG
jgi:hypothetical protein